MATASPGINDFLDLMPTTFKVYAFLGRDTYGAATFSTSFNSYRGHKNDRQHFIRAATGEQVVSSGEIWLATADTIAVNDKVVLPDGSTPLILAVNGADDETGGTLFTKLDLG